MYIHIKAQTGAKKETVKQISSDHFEVAVKEPAKQNLANRRIIEIIQAMFPGTVVRIMNGHHSPSKLLSIEEKG
jgi:uncharacterized protein (TIGR00251 family)